MLGTALQSQPDTAPAVAIVAASGRLLPLATYDGTQWVYFDWPRQGPSESFLPVPKTLADIPVKWLEPLSRLPSVCQFRPLNEPMRDVHIGRPERWEDAWFASIGIRTEYGSGKSEDDDTATGVAGWGGTVLLPVRHVDGSASEWRTIVDSSIGAFAAAERSAGLRSRPTREVLRTQLLKAEVNIWLIEAGARTYLYFSTFLIRAAGCDNAFANHVGLLERRRGGAVLLKWIRAQGGSCQDHLGGANIVGAVGIGQRVWFVLKGGETDPFDFRLADPRGVELESVSR